MRSALALLFLFSCALSASSQSERILDYHSDIQLLSDSSLRVHESIRVLCERDQIRHGIFRDFPTRYKDRLGNRYVVGFDFLNATQDGAPVQYRITDANNGKRIYLGSQSSLVSIGEHTFTIDYTTTRQLGFFKDHDELFWNVTGNGWSFSIDHASATVTLPTTIAAHEVTLSGYTGPQNSQAKDLDWSVQENGTYHFENKYPLPAHEGLTILLLFPKGRITAPTQQEALNFFLHDNSDAMILGVGFAILIFYYLVVWLLVGRDPAPGAIMARYEPPANLSPAAMRYLVAMGFDNKIFTAAILDMAVRGYLTIKEDHGSYSLHRTKASDSVLTTDEKQIAAILFADYDSLQLLNINHTKFVTAIKSLKTWLATTEQKIYFVTNSRYIVPAIVLSILLLIAVGLTLGTSAVAAMAFFSVWLSIWSLGVFGLIFGAYQAWAAVFTSSTGAGQVLLSGKATFLSVFSLPFIAGEIGGTYALGKMTTFLVPIFLIGCVALHILFHFLLKAPTSAGRQLLDQVEGFKLFLGAVDADRLNRANPPNQTPQTFEKFLPYALALGVEKAWAQKFSGIIDQASQVSGTSGGSTYSPSFYSGAGWATLGAAGFASSMSSSFTSAISSSSAAPGSSGGSGGGSGGGGGGGGGGGW